MRKIKNITKIIKEIEERGKERNHILEIGDNITFSIKEVESYDCSDSQSKFFLDCIMTEAFSVLLNKSNNGRYTKEFCESFLKACWVLAFKHEKEQKVNDDGTIEWFSIRIHSTSVCNLLNLYMVKTPRRLAFDEKIVDYIFDNHTTHDSIQLISNSLNKKYKLFMQNIANIQKNIKKVRADGNLNEEACEMRFKNGGIKMQLKEKEKLVVRNIRL
jgi:hypothetical protein